MCFSRSLLIRWRNRPETRRRLDREKTLGMTDESSGTRPVVMVRLKICQRGNAVEETVDFSIRRRYSQVSFGRET